ncbi:MAG: DUF6599 family protein [Candidatus Eisenbacteria bacterium]
MSRFTVSAAALLGAFISLPALAADPPARPIPNPESPRRAIPNPAAITEKMFVGRELDGHIDGGAELFYEFGFRDLLLRTVPYGENEISVEVYRMKSPEGAYGVYLMKMGAETPHAAIDGRNTVGRWQATAVQGNLFVQVNNFSGNEAYRTNMVGEIRKAFLDAGDRGPAPIMNYMPLQDRMPGSERFVCGPLSLQSIATLGDGDILLLGGDVYGAAARYKKGVGPAHTLVRIPYPGPGRATEAFANLAENLDPYLTVVDQEEKKLVFREHDGRYGVARRFGRRIDVKLHLDSPENAFR